MRWALIVSCLISAVAVSAAAEPSTVPDLTGRPTREAEQLGTLAGLPVVLGDFYIAAEKWRNDIVPETIYLQTPQAGAAAAPGTTLAGWRFVRADADQPIVAMPDLRGKTRSEARALLEPLGLPLLKSAADADTNVIADHYPRAAQKVIAGTSVFAMMKEGRRKP